MADLTGVHGVAQSTVSARLASLRDCGLVTGRPERRQMFYALARPELVDLLRAAERLLAVTGEAVALCPSYSCETGHDSDPSTRPAAALSPADTDRLTRRGLRLAQITVAYNVVEGGSRSPPGLVSIVDSALTPVSNRPPRSSSACVWPPGCATAKHDGAKERRTLVVVAVAFYVLAAYVVIEASAASSVGKHPTRGSSAWCS
ncbi:hypothetical protein GCM10020369_43910 [Cryptosporangium minutisporangium]|uniref:HTH arsR-type domain-containing protein n=1 Tax=Cryptosporangium minutisporangium TaxID=113569 RepID=A0ABP6T2J4_9ACTN